ncbi:hypothetical protein MMC24_002361 [Lignoscripta atroalba]|nr:hypothetical protein [Lignoscripta atroalba]
MASTQGLTADNMAVAAQEFKLEQDHKRELDNKHKWALGEAVSNSGRASRRPNKPDQIFLRAHRREIEFNRNKAVKMTKVSRKNVSNLDTDDNTSDSSAEEEIKEASAAPEPDAGITYSFDAPRGPGKGSEILSMAIAKAVEKYETKATEKLVKDEYEVVGKDYEVANEGYIADEDDFEMV